MEPPPAEETRASQKASKSTAAQKTAPPPSSTLRLSPRPKIPPPPRCTIRSIKPDPRQSSLQATRPVRQTKRGIANLDHIHPCPANTPARRCRTDDSAAAAPQARDTTRASQRISCELPPRCSLR